MAVPSTNELHVRQLQQEEDALAEAAAYTVAVDTKLAQSLSECESPRSGHEEPFYNLSHSLSPEHRTSRVSEPNYEVKTGNRFAVFSSPVVKQAAHVDTPKRTKAEKDAKVASTFQRFSTSSEAVNTITTETDSTKVAITEDTKRVEADDMAENELKNSISARDATPAHALAESERIRNKVLKVHAKQRTKDDAQRITIKESNLCSQATIREAEIKCGIMERERLRLRQGGESSRNKAALAADDCGSSLFPRAEWQYSAGQRGDTAFRGCRVQDVSTMSTKMSAPVIFSNTASADIVDESLDLSRMVAAARSTPTQETEDFKRFSSAEEGPTGCF